MLILRYDPNLPVKPSNLLNREFLYKWMNGAMVTGKESGAIKTYLNSVHLHLEFVYLNRRNSGLEKHHN